MANESPATADLTDDRMIAIAAPMEQRSSHDELLAQYLESHDEMCPACSYNLRRLRTTRCPECGFALRIMIGPIHTSTRFFLLGFAALASAFGFTGLSFAWVLIMTIVWGPGPAGWGYFALAAVAVMSGALMIGWSRGAVRFSQASSAARLMLALAAWLVPLASFILFLVLLFTF